MGVPTSIRVFAALLGIGLSQRLCQSAEPEGIDFRSQVAPIFEQHCIRCHHADDARGDISLATVKDLRDGGYVVSGKSGESELLDLITPSQTGKRPRMPKDGKPLTDSEVMLLRRWIDAGARWPDDLVIRPRAKADRSWWSLQPLATAAPPDAAEAPESWRQNPIDRFIWTKLREKGLSPSSAAEPRSLIRRLSYDLTGLPPTPEQVEAYVADPSDAAYERLVDQWLASPAYGEQWGRHWLDVVRFGESNGFERNVLIDNVWPFRDYVIRSFNEDKPFDRLVKEHLAGDQLSPGDASGEIGTAFLVCGPYDNVGNQDPVQAAVIRSNTLDEMIRATGEAFLGVTIGCARCHDHKFDPITQADYYQLFATFAGVVHGERVIATAQEQQEHAARLRELNQRKERLNAQRAAVLAAVNKRGKQLAASLEQAWTRPAADPFGTEETFAPVAARYVRLTALARDDRPELRDGFTIDEFEVWSAEPTPRNVALTSTGAKADGASRIAQDFADAYSARQAIDGRYGGGWIAAGPTLTITLPQLEQISRVTFSSYRATDNNSRRFRKPFPGEYRIEVSSDGQRWKSVAESSDRQPASPAIRNHRLFQAAIRSDERKQVSQIDQQLAEVNRALAAVPPLPRWWAGQFRKADGPFHIFSGGDPQKKSTEVMPASPTFLANAFPGYSLTSTTPEAERRRALAEWITHRDNPLTPRVLANRLWQYHFGTGIVDTPSDFGYMGGKPTHPELLDWLARQLHATGWRLKPLHKQIVMSQTYRQSAKFRPDQAAMDGDSRFLWRFPPRRLTGEEVRDAMLTVAGKLDPKQGGPGFRLYRYLQDNVATYVPLDAPGPETYRRAVYHQNARAARVDVLTDFDCPDPAFAAPRRASTTTPLQALALFNHQFTLDMAESFAARLQNEAGRDPTAQVQRAFLLAYSRPVNIVELKNVVAVIEKHGLRAFARAVLNSNEFLYLD